MPIPSTLNQLGSKRINYGRLQGPFPLSHIPGEEEWTPAQLLNVVAWHRSDLGTFQDAGLSTVANNGDPVRGWVDQISNHNIFCDNDTKRPIRTASLINGHPALVFDGVNDRLVSAVGGFTLTQPFTIVTVVVDADPVAFHVVSMGQADPHQSFITATGSSPEDMRIAAGVALVATDEWTASPMAILAEVNGATSKIRVNGTEYTGDAGTNTPTAQQLTYGDRQDEPGLNWSGAMAETIIVNGTIGTADLLFLNSYILDRYVLSL